jgi:hypothetical protein
MTLVLLLATLLVGALVHRPLMARCGSGLLLHLLRLPGNLLHELSHAVAFLLTGYTVRGFAVSLFDPAGRGHVTPGQAWTRFTRPWVANLIAPVAPALVGLTVLALAQRHLAPRSGSDAAAMVRVLPMLAWGDPVTWAVLVLAVPVGAEASPSDVDLRAWAVPATVASVLVLGVWAVGRAFAPGVAAAMESAWLHADATLRTPAWRALALAAWSALVWLPPAWLIGRLRG